MQKIIQSFTQVKATQADLYNSSKIIVNVIGGMLNVVSTNVLCIMFAVKTWSILSILLFILSDHTCCLGYKYKAMKSVIPPLLHCFYQSASNNIEAATGTNAWFFYHIYECVGTQQIYARKKWIT